IENGFFLKGLLRESALQDKDGPSIATEFGVLLPGINDQHGTGGGFTGILSQRWEPITVHFNAAAAVTREQMPICFSARFSKVRTIGRFAQSPRSSTSASSGGPRSSRLWSGQSGRFVTIWRSMSAYAAGGSTIIHWPESAPG